MTSWFAFQGLNNNKAVSLTGFPETIATADGFHGYATQAEAESKPNSLNPLTKIEAQALLNQGISAGLPPIPSGLPSIPNPAAGFSTISDAVSSLVTNLEKGNFWLRIGEGLLGIILIAVSLAKMTGTDNVISKAIPR
jgi:hypothetical protein